MSDDGKIKPIRKGIKIVDPNKLPKPDKQIISHLMFMLQEASEGRLRELAYVGITQDNTIYSTFLGDMSAPHEMQAELYHLCQHYHEYAFMGFDDEE